MLYVDDVLPCRRDGRAAFAGVDRGVLWPALLEKACAKLYGSYAALDQGAAAEALGLLTGLPTHSMEKIHECRPSPQAMETLFASLQKAHRSGFIISASCGHCGLGKTPDEEEKLYDRVGLLNAHEYAVLRVVELATASAPIRLIQLRNPWAMGEWKGPWSPRAWVGKGGFHCQLPTLESLSDRVYQKKHSPYETLRRDDHRGDPNHMSL